MSGILEKIINPQRKRRLVQHSGKAPWMNPKTMELLAAMEILAEVFGMRISEVEEMLRERSEVGVQSCKGEVALWPESFCLVE